MEIDWKRAWYFISQILSVLGYAFMGLIFSHYIAVGLGKVIFGIQTNDAASVIMNPSHQWGQVMFARLYQGFTNFGFFGLPAFMYLRIYNYPVWSTLKLKKPFTPLQGFLILISAFAGLFGLSLLSDLNQSIPMPESWKIAAQLMAEKQQQLINGLMYMPSQSHLIANIFVVGFIAAFSEELMFRGILQPLFKNWTKNIHFGILLSAALFSAIHFDLNNFIPRFAIAVAFGYLFYWSGNLWVPILAHFLNNSIEVLIYYFKDTNSWCNYFIEVKYFPLHWGLIGILVVGMVLYYFRGKYEAK